MYGQEKTDIVVMKNGDRMTCEIKGLSGGILYVSLDYIDGTISVNWSKVARLESKRIFIVKTANGSSYTGTLSIIEATGSEPEKIEVTEAPDKKVEIPQARVVTADRTSKRFWRRLNGDISVGLTYAKAFQSTQYNLSSSVEYPQERWSAQVSFNSNLTSNTLSGASERNQLDIGLSHLLPQKTYFYSGVAGFLQSSVQSIDLQTTIGGGIGHYFKNTNRARFSVLGGLALQRTKYSSSTGLGTQNALEGLVTTELRVFRFKKTHLNLSAAFLPSITEPGRVFLKLNQSYYVKLYRDLSWNISFYGNWDNRPPGGLIGSDYGTSMGLGWTFGNK
jgi:hypothetical protein